MRINTFDNIKQITSIVHVNFYFFVASSLHIKEMNLKKQIRMSNVKKTKPIIIGIWIQ